VAREVITISGVEGKSGEPVKLRIVQGGSERILEGSGDPLVATGRTPSTNGIRLELAGVGSRASNLPMHLDTT